VEKRGSLPSDYNSSTATGYSGRMDKEAEAPTIMCAWCGKVTARRGSAVSHGICERCALDILEDAGVLDGEPKPVSSPPARPEQNTHTAAS
jgi:hypothetical protein